MYEDIEVRLLKEADDTRSEKREKLLREAADVIHRLRKDLYRQMRENADEEDNIGTLLMDAKRRAHTQIYASHIHALCSGDPARAVLLNAGYVFSATHTIREVLPYAKTGVVPAVFKPVNDTTIGLCDIQFNNVTGDVYGCVVLNDSGLIAYLPVNAHLDGGDLTIISGD